MDAIVIDNGSQRNASMATQQNVVSKIPIPKGQVLVITWHGEKTYDGWWFHAYSQGEMVTPRDLQRGTIIPEGQSAPFNACRYGQHGTSDIPKRVFNRNGIAVIEDDHEPGREFARQQKEWLRGMGFNEKEIQEIMSAARPGQVRPAVQWAIAAVKQWQSETPELRERLIELALGQAVKASKGNYGWARTAKAVEELTGVKAPQAPNAGTFFKIISGAEKVLQIGLPATA